MKLDIDELEARLVAPDTDFPPNSLIVEIPTLRELIRQHRVMREALENYCCYECAHCTGLPCEENTACKALAEVE